ncbi:hypothetical protein GCM10028789_24490 [Sinomonas halotolerans]
MSAGVRDLPQGALPNGMDTPPGRGFRLAEENWAGPLGCGAGLTPKRVSCGIRQEKIMHILDAVDAASLRSDIPAFAPGDTLKVHVNIIEGKNSRVQVFQGFVVGRQGHGVRETFTVRKVSFGVGVERTFPVHSPIIEKIEVVTKGDVRRAKLYYMRELRGKAAKIKEKRDYSSAK